MAGRQTKDMSRREALGLALVAALATFLRLFELGEEGLWLDEGYSLRDAVSLRLSIARPLYYVLLHYWMQLGQGVVWLRLPAVIFGIVGVPLLYLIGRRLYGHQVALLASFLMAVSPMQINHSQEVRMYTLTMMAVLAETLFFVRYVEAGQGRDLIGCLVFVVLAYSAHPMTLFMLLVFNLLLLVWLRPRFREIKAHRWFAVQCLVAMAAIPLIPRLLMMTGGYFAWTAKMPEPGLREFVETTRDFNLWRVPSYHPKAVLLGDVYGVFVLGLIAYGAARTYKSAKWQTGFVLMWLIVPMISMLVASYAVTNMWVTRYMIYTTPAHYLLTAVAIISFKNRRSSALALLVVMSLMLMRLHWYYARLHRPEWATTASYIEQRLSAGDVIALYRYGNGFAFRQYYTGSAPWVALGQTTLTRDQFEVWDSTRIANLLSAIPPGKRIWFVISQSDNVGGRAIEDYIMRHYRLADIREFNQVTIYLILPERDGGRRLTRMDRMGRMGKTLNFER